MSKLAQKIKNAPLAPAGARRGPPNRCFPVYGPGDLEDWNAVEALRRAGHSWREVQAHVDELLGVKNPLPLEKVRYHWRRRCFCWPEDIRL